MTCANYSDREWNVTIVDGKVRATRRPTGDATPTPLPFAIAPAEGMRGRRTVVRVSEPTIVRILRDHGFSPRPGRKVCFDRVRAAAKDALWALDFFWVKSAKRVWLQALLVIDIHTRELLTCVSTTAGSASRRRPATAARAPKARGPDIRAPGAMRGGKCRTRRDLRSTWRSLRKKTAGGLRG